MVIDQGSMFYLQSDLIGAGDLGLRLQGSSVESTRRFLKGDCVLFLEKLDVASNYLYVVILFSATISSEEIRVSGRTLRKIRQQSTRLW